MTLLCCYGGQTWADRGGGGLFRLPRKIPANIAMECALTGDPISALDGQRYGLVNHLTEPGQALEKALARAISANAPLAVRASRAVVLDCTDADDDAAWSGTARAFATVAGSQAQLRALPRSTTSVSLSGADGNCRGL